MLFWVSQHSAILFHKVEVLWDWEPAGVKDLDCEKVSEFINNSNKIYKLIKHAIHIYHLIFRICIYKHKQTVDNFGGKLDKVIGL